MYAFSYIEEVQVQRFNTQGMQVLVEVQNIVANWFKKCRISITISGLMGTFLFLIFLDPLTATYEWFFPPPLPRPVEILRAYRILQHITGAGVVLFFSWCFKICLWWICLEREKRDTQAALEKILASNPGFLDALREVDDTLHGDIVAFLPPDTEGFVR